MDLLETHDVDVVYDFDRTHENMPDKYWATFHALGILLSFDENQILKTIFIFQTPEDDFTPADLSDSDILVFDSKNSVRTHALANTIDITEGYTTVLGPESDWIRFNFPEYQIHYEFSEGVLKKVTITLTKE